MLKQIHFCGSSLLDQTGTCGMADTIAEPKAISPLMLLGVSRYTHKADALITQIKLTLFDKKKFNLKLMEALW